MVVYSDAVGSFIMLMFGVFAIIVYQLNVTIHKVNQYMVLA